jgi:predicted cobalt transporter CbtA
LIQWEVSSVKRSPSHADAAAMNRAGSQSAGCRFFDCDAVMPDSWLRRAQVTARFARILRTVEGFDLLFAVIFVLAHPPKRNADAVLVGLAVFFVINAPACEVLARRYARRGLVMSAEAS